MNKIIKTLFLFTFLINSYLFAQEITIHIDGAKGKAVLSELEGEKSVKIDSVISHSGDFQFTLKNKHYGFYRIQFDKRHFLDFVNDEKDVEIKTDYNNFLDSLKVVKSESNKLYFEFVKLNKSYKTKTELLQLILARYPKDDDYYFITKEKLKEIQNEYLEFVNKESQAKPKSFISRYIKSAQLPVIPQNITSEVQLNYRKSHALDNVNFNDAMLIYSDVFTNKTIEYLTYYRNPRLPKALLEKEFMKAVDTILNKAKVNELVYQQITEYLIDGFKKFGFDKIIDYIVENYVIKDDLCLDEQTENSIQRRIDQSKLLTVGTKAPNILMPDKSGRVIDLSRIKAEKILLVFYASWCPHCQELIPQLVTWSKTQKDISILTISLDNKKDDWLNFIKNNNMNFININDPNGWDGDLASKYFIYATPTMFLLDSEKRIIGKPTAFKELKILMDK